MGTKPIANKVFMTTARAIASDAKEIRDVLVQNGMPAPMFDEFIATVDELEAVRAQMGKGLVDHVEARSRLHTVAGEVRELVVLLDGLNRYRYRHQPEMLTAWDSARNVVAPVVDKVAGPADGQGTPKASGEGLPAAA